MSAATDQPTGETDLPEASQGTEPDTSGLSRFIPGNRAQMSMDLPSVILMIGIAVVSGFVVLYLSSEVISAINMSEGDPLYPAFESLEEATNSAFGLFGLLFIVVILSVAIVYLWRIRGAR